MGNENNLFCIDVKVLNMKDGTIITPHELIENPDDPNRITLTFYRKRPKRRVKLVNESGAFQTLVDFDPTTRKVYSKKNKLLG